MRKLTLVISLLGLMIVCAASSVAQSQTVMAQTADLNAATSPVSVVPVRRYYYGGYPGYYYGYRPYVYSPRYYGYYPPRYYYYGPRPYYNYYRGPRDYFYYGGPGVSFGFGY